MKNFMKIFAFIGMVVSSVSLSAMTHHRSVINSIEAPAHVEVLLVTTLDPMSTGTIRSGNLTEYALRDSALVVVRGGKADLSKEISVYETGTPLRLMVVANDKVSFPKTDELGAKNTIVVAEDGSVSFKAAQ